jgi:hypothetical protein
MRLETHRATIAVAAVLFTVVLVAAGCSFGSGSSLQKTPPTTTTPLDTGPIAGILEMMSTLPQADPGAQAETFQSAKDAAELTPTTTNKLRYALALATPGHSGSDPVAAERQLSELLARPETLLPTERMLALIELKQVEQRLVLVAESKRLRDDAVRDSSGDKLAAANRRLAAESDENARLRKALDEARAKLEAVTHIERSINDRGSSVPSNP